MDGQDMIDPAYVNVDAMRRWVRLCPAAARTMVSTGCVVATVVALLAAAVLPAAGRAAVIFPSRLTQLEGLAGCIESTNSPVNPGVDGCQAADLGTVNAVVASPDGANVYSISDATITAFARAADGSLAQIQTVAVPLRGGVDQPGKYGSVAISPDGKNLYVGNTGALAVLTRHANGTLSQPTGAAGCVNATGVDCAQGPSGFYADWVVVSPDGQSVYSGTAGANGTLSVLRRNAADGSLTSAGCVVSVGSGQASGCNEFPDAASAAAMAVSPDGRFAYVSNTSAAELDVFTRNTSTGALAADGCVVSVTNQQPAGSEPCATTGRQLAVPGGIAISSNGKSLYVANADATNPGVAVFRRDANGGLSQDPGANGCLSALGSDACTQSRALGGAGEIALDRRDVSLYVASPGAEAIAAFDRRSDGTLSQLSGKNGCHSIETNTLGCSADRGMGGLHGLAISGSSVYGAGAYSVVVFARGLALPPLPVIGRTVNVATVSGHVFVKLPGKSPDRLQGTSAASSGFVPLTSASQIPVGSILDTTQGRVRLTSAANTHGKTQTAEFYDGGFRVTQKRRQALTTLQLVGGHSAACPHAASADLGLLAIAARRHPRRSLWGSGRGSYTTTGSTASATVRGTTWLTEDFCEGTLVSVRRGTVAVRDFVRHKTIIVHAPNSYFAAKRRR